MRHNRIRQGSIQGNLADIVHLAYTTPGFSPMHQQIIDLYDRFTHGDISRRAFVARLARITGSTSAALALLPLLVNDYARAETVAANDPRLFTNTVYYKGSETEIATYLARP